MHWVNRSRSPRWSKLFTRHCELWKISKTMQNPKTKDQPLSSWLSSFPVRVLKPRAKSPCKHGVIYTLALEAPHFNKVSSRGVGRPKTFHLFHPLTSTKENLVQTFELCQRLQLKLYDVTDVCQMNHKQTVAAALAQICLREECQATEWHLAWTQLHHVHQAAVCYYKNHQQARSWNCDTLSSFNFHIYIYDWTHVLIELLPPAALLRT